MNMLNYFFRPSALDAADEQRARDRRTNRPAPDSWKFSGWFFAGEGSANFEGVNPLSCSRAKRDALYERGAYVAGVFRIEGFVAAVHRTDKQFGGANLHIIFSSEPPPRSFRAEFAESREGGLISNYTRCGYSRQFHVVAGDESIARTLEAAHLSGQRISMSGCTIWAELEGLRQSIAQRLIFRGFGPDTFPCPMIEVEEIEESAYA